MDTLKNIGTFLYMLHILRKLIYLSSLKPCISNLFCTFNVELKRTLKNFQRTPHVLIIAGFNVFLMTDKTHGIGSDVKRCGGQQC